MQIGTASLLKRAQEYATAFNMQLLIKFFPEITIRSRVVRRNLSRQLHKNIQKVLSNIDQDIRVTRHWDNLQVVSTSEDLLTLKAIHSQLLYIPGVALVQEVLHQELPSLEEILRLSVELYAEEIAGKTFAVRCRRIGQHPYSSMDVERFVGAGLITKTAAKRVDLENPEYKVAIEIRGDALFLVKRTSRGLGGFPLGCQESALSLISGGFDSSVSSYMTIRRGVQTHFLFFNLGGSAHEMAVKQIAFFLWNKYHSSHRVKFITVPFEGVVEQIVTQVDNAYMGVVLKRMMMRAASRVAKILDIDAIVTGESIAQVSSQTLSNLQVIDRASESFVLRPLITMDKQDIINKAREIDAERFSLGVPEYCAVISKTPTTAAKVDRLEREEARFDFSVLEQSLQEARYQLITELPKDFENYSLQMDLTGSLSSNSIVIDIRHPWDIERKPLDTSTLGSTPVLALPFYKLGAEFATLDSKKSYLLHCDNGIMSKLHTAHLRHAGFPNVAVLETQ